MSLISEDCIFCGRSRAMLGVCNECMSQYVKQVTEGESNERR